MLYIYREYFLYLQSYASGNFLQKCFTFAEQRHKFSQDHKGQICKTIETKTIYDCLVNAPNIHANTYTEKHTYASTNSLG